MQKQNAKNCLFWFLGALVSNIISVLLLILAIATQYPAIGRLIAGLAAGIWVTLALIWGAYQIKKAEWDDELVVLLSVLAVLFAVTCGGTLFIVAMIQAVPG